MHINDAAKVEKVIRETLDHVVETGFESDRVESILHRTELALKNKVYYLYKFLHFD